MSSARKAAFAILLRVECESGHADELLHSALVNKLSVKDRNLVQEMVMGVLRWQSLLDAGFADHVKTPLAKLDVEVLIALRMGAYQLAFLDRIPGRAVVYETVEMVKRSPKRSAATLVNAVLRKLEPGRQNLRPEGKGLAQDWAHPPWLVEKWIAGLGRELAETICRADQQIPATILRLSGPLIEVEEQLRAEGVQLAPGALMKNARVVIAGDVTRSKLFHSRSVAIQDEGSQLVAALIGEGSRILDCCAAPGGKTAAMALALPKAEIFATELHPHRARLLRKLAPQRNIHVFAADARQLPLAAKFDRILADVPCSGTGTLGRNPEIKWRLQPGDFHDLQQRQVAILNAALKQLEPAGRLVYSTCSLEQEENETVIEKALHGNQGFEIVPVRGELLRLKDAGVLVWQDVDALVSGNFLRTFPGKHPCDGFFAAILRRTASSS